MQLKCLYTVISVYKAMLIQYFKIKAAILLIDLYFNKKVADFKE